MNATTTIFEAARLLLEPGSVAELRILNTRRGTVSGYYDDFEKLAQGAAQWDGEAPGLYITLNPVNPDLLARSTNRLTNYAKHSTSDDDILRRRWLPLDFDPIRPSGISSTDAQHAAALTRAQEAREWLCELGWPEPIYADSGNGGHLLYRIDLPNDAESTALVRRCLEAMALRFGDEAVVADVKTYNAARIWKFYGTTVCKGDSTPDRPHRVSEVLDAPGVSEVVPRALLERLAAMVPQPERHQAHFGRGDFSLDSWIEEHDLSVVKTGAWNGGRKWILSPCPWNPDHADGAAYIVQFASGAIAAGCHHNGCAGND